jgi:DNA-binding response OmpR family regulator
MAINRSKRTLPRGVRGKVVLVIEDDKEIRLVVAHALQKKDYDVVLVDTAEDGINLINDIAVDLVITDIFMRGKGGLWAIQSIKQKKPELKVLSMSGGWRGLAGEDVTRAAQKVGADLGLNKPFELPELYAAVESLIGGALEIRI